MGRKGRRQFRFCSKQNAYGNQCIVFIDSLMKQKYTAYKYLYKEHNKKELRSCTSPSTCVWLQVGPEKGALAVPTPCGEASLAKVTNLTYNNTNEKGGIGPPRNGPNYVIPFYQKREKFVT